MGHAFKSREKPKAFSQGIGCEDLGHRQWQEWLKDQRSLNVTNQFDWRTTIRKTKHNSFALDRNCNVKINWREMPESCLAR